MPLRAVHALSVQLCKGKPSPQYHSSCREVNPRAKGRSRREHAQRPGSKRLLDRRSFSVGQAGVMKGDPMRDSFLRPGKIQRGESVNLLTYIVLRAPRLE